MPKMTYGRFKALNTNETVSIGATLPDTTTVQCDCLIYFKRTQTPGSLPGLIQV